MSLDNSRVFWDAKAAENPYWYVSSYGPYDERNLTEFWDAGRRIWRDLREAIGYVPGHDDVVVEIGCGVGRLTRHPAQAAAVLAELARLGVKTALDDFGTGYSSLAYLSAFSVDVL